MRDLPRSRGSFGRGGAGWRGKVPFGLGVNWNDMLQSGLGVAV